MSAHTALTIAAALVAWCVISCVVGLIVARFFYAASHQRVSESDQESAAHCHAELDGAGLPAGMIGHFHAGSNLTTRERNHA